METKKCRRCGNDLPLDMFYKHSQMADGHLNICMKCVKTRVNKHRADNIEKIRAYDRERAKLPHRKKARKEIAAKHNEDELYKKSHQKVGNAIRDKRLIRNICCQACGSTERIEAHHYDYSKPFDVIWLCMICHRQYHMGKSDRANTVKSIVDNIIKIHSADDNPSKVVGD